MLVNQPMTGPDSWSGLIQQIHTGANAQARLQQDTGDGMRTAAGSGTVGDIPSGGWTPNSFSATAHPETTQAGTPCSGQKAASMPGLAQPRQLDDMPIEMLQYILKKLQMERPGEALNIALVNQRLRDVVLGFLDSADIFKAETDAHADAKLARQAYQNRQDARRYQKPYPKLLNSETIAAMLERLDTPGQQTAMHLRLRVIPLLLVMPNPDVSKEDGLRICKSLLAAASRLPDGALRARLLNDLEKTCSKDYTVLALSQKAIENRLYMLELASTMDPPDFSLLHRLYFNTPSTLGNLTQMKAFYSAAFKIAEAMKDQPARLICLLSLHAQMCFDLRMQLLSLQPVWQENHQETQAQLMKAIASFAPDALDQAIQKLLDLSNHTYLAKTLAELQSARQVP